MRQDLRIFILNQVETVHEMLYTLNVIEQLELDLPFDFLALSFIITANDAFQVLLY